MTTESEPGAERLDPGLRTIIREQPRLMNLAYRLLGSLAEAEDVVQETCARWYAMSEAEQEAIESPGAWLTTVATRLCLDALRSARLRRERYVGEWLPEPLPDRTEWMNGLSTAATVDPADRVSVDESVNMAFLVVLEAMTPAERVAFILHDVFGYPFRDVAEIVGRTPGACRQLALSARRRIGAAQRPARQTVHQADVVRKFKRAWEAQDIQALVRLLDPDVTAVSDGGGVVAALGRVEGGEEVARAFVGFTTAVRSVSILERTVNGQPGLVVQQDGATVTVMAFAVARARIHRIWSIRNPEKLRPWTSRTQR